MQTQAQSFRGDAPADRPRRLLTEKEAARMLGTSTQYLVKWRFLGKPIVQFMRLGRMIRYRQSDIEAFMSASGSDAVVGSESSDAG